MFITDLISITELSRLTKKSRPTIYKYINDYYNGNFDEIPYTFIKLFELSKEANVSKEKIKMYCLSNYGDFNNSENEDLKRIIELLNNNLDVLDLGKIKSFIEGELKNE